MPVCCKHARTGPLHQRSEVGSNGVTRWIISTRGIMHNPDDLRRFREVFNLEDDNGTVVQGCYSNDDSDLLGDSSYSYDSYGSLDSSLSVSSESKSWCGEHGRLCATPSAWHEKGRWGVKRWVRKAAVELGAARWTNARCAMWCQLESCPRIMGEGNATRSEVEDAQVKS